MQCGLFLKYTAFFYEIYLEGKIFIAILLLFFAPYTTFLVNSIFQKNIVCMKLKLALQRLSVEAEMRRVNLKLHYTVSFILCRFCCSEHWDKGSFQR